MESNDCSSIVVKLGTSTLTAGTSYLSPARMVELVRQLAQLHNQGCKVVLVSSGAMAAGRERLAFPQLPKDIPAKQMLSAVGQPRLMALYEQLFDIYKLTVAQVLLTRTDLADRSRYLNSRNTLSALLSQRIIPIINENDTVATEEIRVGDNDTLGALVTNLVEADMLVILTDQAGLFSADPRKNPQATLLPEVRAGDPQLEQIAGGAGSAIGLGGMLTKVLAAKRAARSGAHTVIASGHEENVLVRLARGERIGTLLKAATQTLAARKQWLADHLQVRGRLILDEGAVKALRDQRKSLLPIGVFEVAGEFERGEAVVCCGPDGTEIARGLVNYSASESRRILKTPSSEIEAKLGYVDEPELIHRDNLVLL